MSTIDYSKYLPAKLRETDLNLKAIEMINHLTTEQREEFKDVLLKYKDPFSITEDAAREVIKEFGFEYITDIVETLSNEDLGTLVTYMGFISTMKGHKTGLEVIFSLLGFAYEMVEWWEYDKDRKKGHLPTSKNLTVDEWKLTIDINQSTSLNNIFATVPKLHTFVRNYVYPVLAYLELLFVGVIDNISITGAGVELRLEESTTSLDTHKIVSGIGTEKNILNEEVTLTPDLSTDLFDNAILLEHGYNIYTGNSEILKLG